MTSKQMATNKTSKIKENKSFQIELQETLQKIMTYKINCEANIVSIFWKEPQLFFDYDDIVLNDFDENMWRVFYEIAHDIIVNEEKTTLDEITVGLYLEKHLKLQEKYIEYGGYESIEKVREYVQTSNMDAYIQEFKKWNIIKNLAKDGHPINNRLSDFVNMSIDDIYNEYEAKINNIFANEHFAVKSYDISDNILDEINRLDNGVDMGLPISTMPYLSKELGGIRRGDVTLVGGVSNAGKSTFLRMTLLPSIMQGNEKLVVFLNEEGIGKWQREMLVWIANNIKHADIQKWQVRDGNYTPELKALLYECAQWLIEKKGAKHITLIPLEKYSTSMVLKLIKKYASLGVKYFAIDTFKIDNTDDYSITDNARLQLVQNMTNLYNVVKESNKNVSLICTVQLTKGSSKLRHLTLDSIGESKNIVDPCATALFIRNMYEDELPGGSHPLKVHKFNNMSSTPVAVTLDNNKKYQIIFIAKSRESQAGVGSYQIVAEVDYSRNTLNEIGYTNVPIDF